MVKIEQENDIPFSVNKVTEELGKPNKDVSVGYREDSDEFDGSDISHDELIRGLNIWGSTGYGKSTLMRNIMVQLASQGEGFCYMTSRKGDKENLMEALPDNRKEDVVDLDNNLGIDAMTSRILAIVEKSEEHSLKEAWKILTDEETRNNFLQKFEDSADDFVKTIRNMDKSDFDPIARNLENIVNVDLKEIIDNNKILVVGASHFSHEIRQLVGLYMIENINEAARKSSNNYYLFIDETPHFLHENLDLEEILSTSRSAGLGIILSFQSPDQIKREHLESIESNIPNNILFNIGMPNINTTGTMFEDYEYEELGAHEAISHTNKKSKIKTYPPLTEE